MSADVVTVLTLGHSNLALEDFLARLDAHGIERVVDVRRFPGSRKWPWFARENLEAALEDAGVAYAHAPALGGRRKPVPDSPNTGWENESFRAYADYVGTRAFEDALAALVEDAARARTAVMCSEAVWWRCHRRLIADALVARGHVVLHVLGTDKPPRPHALTPFARVAEDGALTYPDPQRRLPS